MKSKPALLVAVIMTAVALMFAHATFAAVPGETSYQGLLLDDLGDPVTATVAMEFEIFDAPNAGTALWFESHPAVQVVDGVYDVVLQSDYDPIIALSWIGARLMFINDEGFVLLPGASLVQIVVAIKRRFFGARYRPRAGERAEAGE